MPSEHATVKHKYQLQWLWRWGRRWSISLASIAAREHVHPEEACQKVNRFMRFLTGTILLRKFGNTLMAD